MIKMQWYNSRIIRRLIFGIVAVGIFSLVCKYGILLLSDVSPHIYEELYPADRDGNDTLIICNVPFQINDTLQIDSKTIISHKTILIPQTRTETKQNNTKPTAEQLGVLGDSAGLWNALFSAFALIGVIFTIFYQDYRDNKNEKSYRCMRFQEEFYRLLDCISKVVVELEIPIGESFSDEQWGQMLKDSPYSGSTTYGNNMHGALDRLIKGRACFEYVYHKQPNCIKDVGLSVYNDNEIDLAYESLDNIFVDYFSHYFRLLYRLLKFINSADYIKDLKECPRLQAECYGILKAHLSTFELIVIFYNGLLMKNNKAKPLYETARLFDNININYLVFSNEKKYYEAVIGAKTRAELPEDEKPIRFYETSAFIVLQEESVYAKIVKLASQIKQKLKLKQKLKKYIVTICNILNCIGINTKNIILRVKVFLNKTSRKLTRFLNNMLGRIQIIAKTIVKYFKGKS